VGARQEQIRVAVDVDGLTERSGSGTGRRGGEEPDGEAGHAVVHVEYGAVAGFWSVSEDRRDFTIGLAHKLEGEP
jgi:hypothetical protein